MSYTIAKNAPQGAATTAVSLLREALISEDMGIDSYTYIIQNVKDQSLKDLFKEIRSDEKKHYNIFLNLIRKYDKDQYNAYKDIKKKNSSFDGVVVDKGSLDPDFDLISAIRDAIKGENEAIILYQANAAKSKVYEIKKELNTIAIDEMHHLEELNDLLEKITKN